MENMLDVAAQRSDRGVLIEFKHANTAVLLAVAELNFVVLHLLNAVDNSFF